MKNLHLLPTEKPSRLHTWINDKGLRAALYEEPQLENPNTAKNIYITSDEEIKDGEWHLHYYENKPVISKSHNNAVKTINEIAEQFGYKKIILTTNALLINDGIQAIDDEFLEWFVKNPNCDFVRTLKVPYFDESSHSYVLIITKEEDICPECGSQGMTLTPKTQCYCGYSPKEEIKQETLEEAAKNYGKIRNELDYGQLYCNSVDSFKAGAKWQQEQNSKLHSIDDEPKEFEPILAKIKHLTSLGTSTWYEVVYFCEKWKSYSESKTFEDGEQVIQWIYCKDLFKI